MARSVYLGRSYGSHSAQAVLRGTVCSVAEHISWSVSQRAEVRLDFIVCRYLLDDDEEDWAFNNDSTLTVGRNY